MNNISSGLVRYFALVPAVVVKFYFNVLHYNYSTTILFYSRVLKTMKTKKKKIPKHNIKTVYDLQKLDDIFYVCAFVMGLIFISTS